jgi:hypothetical protein
MLSLDISRLKIRYILSLPVAMTVVAISPVQAQVSDSPATPTQSETPNPNSTKTQDMRSLSQSDSLLSLQGGQKLMQEADQAIDSQQYDLAAQKLQKARQLFNQLSNFHLQLSESFSGIDNRIAEEQRNKALETGQMRDEATYQLALVHRAQNQPELSVPLLIQVVRSQNPTSELGKKSYQQLVEIGFAKEPFSTPTSPTSGK